MDLECFLYPGWQPRIRAASARRTWMDETPERFAYRCLPLAIANAQGWEIASSVGFQARWTGGIGVEAVEIVLDNPELNTVDKPVSLFGQATLTFHVPGLFRTSPGWNLWVGGSPNSAKDGIAPLSAIIETDWSPYSFTMNWRFTRPNQWIRFEPDEPYCFFFPVERNAVEAVIPRVRPIEDAPDLKQQFEDWSRSRDAFHVRIREHPPTKPADQWQKLYFRGVCPNGEPGAADHQTKVRAREFEGLSVPPLSRSTSRQAAPAAVPETGAERQLARRDWLLDVQERLRALSPLSGNIHRVEDIDPDDFLDHHYAANRPVVLGGEMAGWLALTRWSPAYLKTLIGDATVDVQTGRLGNARFELEKDRHRESVAFSRFIDRATAPGVGNDIYLTAYNSDANRAALAPLHGELGRIDKLLQHGPAADESMLWIGPKGSFTPLHHDLTNNLLVQLTGRKRIILAPPSETPRLRNVEHVFSQVGDLLDPATITAQPDLVSLRIYDVMLEPGDALFIPVGWWHQVTAQDFSVSATYTNFRWPNQWAEGFR